jgi:hypothetical protein
LPDSETLCGLPPALSVIVNAPLRVPLTVGSKKTPMEQLEPAERLPPQALRTPKSFVLVETALIVSVASPVLVAVIVWGSPEVPTYWPGNVMFEGERVSAGAGVVWPLRLIN